MSENALLKRHKLLKIFMIHCDSYKKRSKVPPSTIMQASIRRVSEEVLKFAKFALLYLN